MMALAQSSFHTILASIFEMKLELNLLNWNVSGLEDDLELEDMKRSTISVPFYNLFFSKIKLISLKLGTSQPTLHLYYV